MYDFLKTFNFIFNEKQIVSRNMRETIYGKWDVDRNKREWIFPQEEKGGSV